MPKLNYSEFSLEHDGVVGRRLNPANTETIHVHCLGTTVSNCSEYCGISVYRGMPNCIMTFGFHDNAQTDSVSYLDLVSIICGNK